MKLLNHVITLTICTLLFSPTSYAIDWNPFSMSNKDKKLKLAKVISNMSEAGALAFGPKSSSLSSFNAYHLDFQIDSENPDQSDCYFRALNSDGDLQEYKFTGPKCVESVNLLNQLKLSSSKKWAFVSYIGCTVSSLGESAIIDMTCNISQPFVDWN